MSELKEMLTIAKKFREERDWEKFHDPKNLAMALNCEAAEVLEHFLWVKKGEMKNYSAEKKGMIADELVDTLHPILLIADYYKIDLVEAFKAKMKKNELKYPADTVRGRHVKNYESNKK